MDVLLRVTVQNINLFTKSVNYLTGGGAPHLRAPTFE